MLEACHIIVLRVIVIVHIVPMRRHVVLEVGVLHLALRMRLEAGVVAIRLRVHPKVLCLEARAGVVLVLVLRVLMLADCVILSPSLMSGKSAVSSMVK